MRRRRALQLAGTGLFTGLAGCSALPGIFGPSPTVRWKYELPPVPTDEPDWDSYPLARILPMESRIYLSTQWSVIELDEADGTNVWSLDASRPSIDVYDDWLYVTYRTAESRGTPERVFEAYDRASHTVDWKRREYHSPYIDRGTLYFSRENTLKAYTPTGDRKWVSPPFSGLLWGVVTSDSALFFTKNRGDDPDSESGVISFSRTDGSQRWLHADGRIQDSPLVRDGDRLFVGEYASSLDAGLQALSTTDGSLQWRTELQTNNVFPGDVVDDTVVQSIYSPTYGTVALDVATGRERWSVGGWSEVAVDGSHVYVTDRSYRIAKIAVENGESVWTHELNRFTKTPGAGLGNALQVDLVGSTLFVQFQGTIFGIDSNSGSRKWTYEPSESVTRFTAPEPSQMYVREGRTLASVVI